MVSAQGRHVTLPVHVQRLWGSLPSAPTASVLHPLQGPEFLARAIPNYFEHSLSMRHVSMHVNLSVVSSSEGSLVTPICPEVHQWPAA